MNTPTVQLQQRYAQYVMGTYPVADIAFVRGKGTHLIDLEGRDYLDFAAGIAVCSLGHCHEKVVRAISEQAGTLMHVSNLFMNTRQVELAEKMVKATHDGVCFFCNSGAEANEGMIKLARKWGNPQGRNEIIVMNDSFHGRTLATLAATGRAKYRKGFEPNVEGFVHVPFNDLEAVKSAKNERTVAVMLELVQGEGGVLPADPDYVRGLRRWCTENNILLMLDEVQCGMGRTGKLFSFQHYGIVPDVFSSAKGIANGFPMGMFLARREFAHVLTPGTHASTFGGTPLACAAAIAVLDVMLHDGAIDNAAEVGAYFKEKLQAFIGKYPFVKAVRGLGLMVGLVLDRPPQPFLAQLRNEHRILALPAGESVMRFVPALIVSKAEVDQCIAALDAVFSSPSVSA